MGATWSDPADDDANVAWSRAYHEAVQQFDMGGGYVNFTSDDDHARVQDNYRENYRALAQVKQQYDPDNLFRLNQNITPRSGVA